MQAILLVDAISRSELDLSINELKRSDITVISDLKELLRLDVDDVPVIILEGYMHVGENTNDLLLYKEMLDLSYIFISDNSTLVEYMKQYAKVYISALKKITYNTLIAAVNDDVSAFRQMDNVCESKYETIAKMVLTDPTLADAKLKDMAFTLLSTLSMNKSLLKQLETCESDKIKLEDTVRVKDEKLGQMSKYLGGILKQTLDVNDKLKEYSFICDTDVLTKVNLEEFKDKPNIIYFKEHLEFLHIGSFIKTLQESFVKQYSMPTKILWILDKNNPTRIGYVPKYFKTFIGNTFNKMDLHTNDFICTTSGYVDIIRNLCINTANAYNLIIIDSKQTRDCVLYDQDFIKFDLCRTIEKLDHLNLVSSRTIVNEGVDKDLSWDFYSNYCNLETTDRSLFLMNRPVIHNITKQVINNFKQL